MRSHPPRTASTMLDAALAALTAERLGLRRFRPQDLDTFVADRSNPKIARNQNWEAPYRPSQARQFLRQPQAIHPDSPANGSNFPGPGPNRSARRRLRGPRPSRRSTPGQDRLHPCPRAPGVRLGHRDCSDDNGLHPLRAKVHRRAHWSCRLPGVHAAERPFRGRSPWRAVPERANPPILAGVPGWGMVCTAGTRRASARCSPGRRCAGPTWARPAGGTHRSTGSRCRGCSTRCCPGCRN